MILQFWQNYLTELWWQQNDQEEKLKVSFQSTLNGQAKHTGAAKAEQARTKVRVSP